MVVVEERPSTLVVVVEDDCSDPSALVVVIVSVVLPSLPSVVSSVVVLSQIPAPLRSTLDVLSSPLPLVQICCWLRVEPFAFVTVISSVELPSLPSVVSSVVVVSQMGPPPTLEDAIFSSPLALVQICS